MSTGYGGSILSEPRLPGSAPAAPVPSRPGAWHNVGNDERLLSLLAGGLLAGIGAARRGPLGTFLALCGGGLVYRAVTGHCYTYQALGISTVPQNHGVRADHGVRVSKGVHIARPPEEVASFWGQLTGLPKIMRHLERVDQLEGNRSHWVAKVLGMRFEWDAETTAFVEGQLIRWRSLPGGDVDTEGAVLFEPDAAGGTILRVEMRYDPPGGAVGDRAARLLGGDLDSQLDEDLRRFKAAMEAGATTL